jgi:hypothetical protein
MADRVRIFQARNFVNVEISLKLTSIFSASDEKAGQYILNIWIRMARVLLQDLVGVGGMWCFFTHGS